MAKLDNLSDDESDLIDDLARLVEIEWQAVQTYTASLAAGHERLNEALRRLGAAGRALGKNVGEVTLPVTSVTVTRNGEGKVTGIYVNESTPD